MQKLYIILRISIILIARILFLGDGFVSRIFEAIGLRVPMQFPLFSMFYQVRLLYTKLLIGLPLLQCSDGVILKIYSFFF